MRKALLLNSKPTDENVALSSELKLPLRIGENEIHDKGKEPSLFTFAKKNVNGHESSLFFVDLDVVHGQYTKWFKLLPRVKPFYAVKCNPDPVIVKTLATFPTACFDCASEAEIRLVLNCGVKGENIIFANPMKPTKSIKYALLNGIQTFTFDSVDEVKKIAKVSKELNIPCQLVIRLRVDDSHSELPLGQKFGSAVSDTDKLLDIANECELDVIGVSFHVGSGCTDSIAYENAVRLAHSVFEIAASRGIIFSLLDIGGGFPGVDDDSEGISIYEIARTLNPVLNELFPIGCGVEIISEPGRYFVAACQELAVRIMRVKKIESVIVDDVKEDDEKREDSIIPKCIYYLSEGVFGAFKDSVLLQVSFIPEILLSVNEESKDKLIPCKLMGPSIHSSIDIVSKKTYLPLLEEGDWIYYKIMGAYTDSLKSISADATVKIYSYVFNKELNEEEGKDEVVECVSPSGRRFSIPSLRNHCSATNEFLPAHVEFTENLESQAVPSAFATGDRMRRITQSFSSSTNPPSRDVSFSSSIANSFDVFNSTV